MGRKKIPQQEQKAVAALKQDLKNTIKDIDRFRPYLKDVIICAQHLWLTSNQYMLTEENINDPTKSKDLFEHIGIIRDLHENILRLHLQLENARKVLNDQYLKELTTMHNAMEISIKYNEIIAPLLMGINTSVREYLAPASKIVEVYGEKIKETVGESFYDNLEYLVVGVNQKADLSGLPSLEDMNVDPEIAEEMLEEALSTPIEETEEVQILEEEDIPIIPVEIKKEETPV